MQAHANVKTQTDAIVTVFIVNLKTKSCYKLRKFNFIDQRSCIDTFDVDGTETRSNMILIVVLKKTLNRHE